jgi:hypothetical protein
MFRFVFAALLCSAFISAAPGAATAASTTSATDCPEHFASGMAPVITNAKLQPQKLNLAHRWEHKVV